MMIEYQVHTPSEWGDHHSFYEVFDDPRQRRALAMIYQFGTSGGGDRVCFVGDLIIIASPPEPMSGDTEVGLVVRPLDDFLKDIMAEQGLDPGASRWVEKIVHWPDLGC